MIRTPGPATAFPLPLVVEGVTASWLSRVLGHPIGRCDIVDVLLGTSTKIRVRLDSDGALPETLIVKGGFEAHSPQMAAMYANEAAFYARVAPVLPITTPRCWFAGSDPSSHQSIVILDDLVPLGVTFLHGQRPQSREAIERRLRALARFHAATWNDAGFGTGGQWHWVAPRFGGWSLEYARRYLIPDVWRHYVESPRGSAVSVRFHDRDWMERVFADLAAIEAAGPVVLIHGDTHLGNLYVLPDGKPGFLDAQVSRASPFTEIAYHITCACDLATRADWEQALLGVYLDALRNHGVTPPAWDEAWLRYRQHLAYGYFVFLINEVRFQTEAVNTAYTARFGAAMLDHNVLSLIGV